MTSILEYTFSSVKYVWHYQLFCINDLFNFDKYLTYQVYVMYFVNETVFSQFALSFYFHLNIMIII